jgi:hypothetical protein
MSSFTLTINGVDYLPTMVLESLSVTESAQVRGFTLSARLLINDQTHSTPEAGQFVVFSQDGVRQFAGRIANVEQVQSMLPTHLAYDISCVDHSTDLDSKLIQTVFPSQIAGDTIRQIVGQVGNGFSVNNVADGPPIGEIDADLEVPSAIIQRIADANEYQWFVDYNRDVNFFFLLDRAAPIVQIDVDNDLVTYEDLEWREEWDQVKNRIYLTGAKAKSEFQESQGFAGDGAIRFFPLNYEPWDLETITVTVDAAPQSILLDTVDGQAGDGKGSAGEAYVCIENWGVRFPDDHAPAANEAIAITYNYAFEPVVIVEDPESIATMRALENTAGAPSDGVHEMRFEVPGLRVDTEDDLVSYGQLLLLRYAKILKVASFTSYVQGWTVGQNLRIFSSASRRDFDEIMFVRRITKSIRYVDADNSVLAFEIEAASTPFVG